MSKGFRIVCGMERGGGGCRTACRARLARTELGEFEGSFIPRLSLSDFRFKSVRSESEARELRHNDEIKISDTIMLF